MQRQQDWPHKLRLYLEAMASAEFAWGQNDCCTLVTDWIFLTTDADVYGDFRGQYDDAKSAARLIRTVTGTGVTVEDAAAYIAAKHGMAEVTPLHAQRGDAVLFDGTNGPMLGLVSLQPGRSVFLQEQGLLSLRTDACRRVWRV